MARMRSTFALAGGIATIVLLVGTQDLESYDHAFFSLDRGTRAESVRMFGQPMYTLALAFGVRLPLHGNLGASPAAALAPYLPAPATYWLLLGLAIAVAAVLVRGALRPLCGPAVTWFSLVLLFWSVPIANYAIFADWPETAVTYCAFVGCVFGPHAFLALGGSVWLGLRARLIVAAAVCGLVAGAHPGYWPLLAAAVAVSCLVALMRTEYPLGTRLTAVVTLAFAALLPVVLQAPDIVRDVMAARSGGDVRRLVQGPEGSLIASNAFPFARAGARGPFMFLVGALVSMLVASHVTDSRHKRLIFAVAGIGAAFGVIASTVTPDATVYAPSATWAMRDPAIAFAVLAMAVTLGAVRGRRTSLGAAGSRTATAALVAAGLQGPAYATSLVADDLRQAGDRSPWTHDFRSAEERVAARGLSLDRFPPGRRLALWPGVDVPMRNARQPVADFADAGYLLTTAWTKQRTMRAVVEPNDLLFNQTTDLSPEILCDAASVAFLQLRYLLMPEEASCAAWSPMSGSKIDGSLVIGVASGYDSRVRGLPRSMLTDAKLREPALSPQSRLIPALIPLDGTTLALAPTGIDVHVGNMSPDRYVLVLPVAYDPAWRTTSGRIQNVGGLLALADVTDATVRLEFGLDAVAALRAMSLALGQITLVIALIGMGLAEPLIHDAPRG
jgi:hypothetical protein